MSNYTVPKNLRKVSEEFHGLPLRYVMVVAGTAIICLILVIMVLASSHKIIPLLMLFIVIAFFGKFMKNPNTLTRSWLAYNFLIRGLQGKNVIPKYAVSASFMKQIVPIVEFHDEGIIEFTENQWGLLMRTSPDRVSEDDLEHHINSVKLLVDSLHSDIMLKSYVVSNSTSNKPVEKTLLASMNGEGRTKSEKTHLFSLYESATEVKAPIISWKFYMFLGLGIHATLEDAKIAKQQFYLGIVNRMTNCGMHSVLIQNKNELAITYRKIISQVSI